MTSLDVRRAVPTDVDELIAIERSCADAPHWSEDQWLDLLSHQSEAGSARMCVLARRENLPAGFIVAHCTLDVAEIESVAVQASNRRQGIGSRLCSEAIAWARSQSAVLMQLEVRASSAGAISLYTSLGFVENGRRRAYYRNPPDDAVLMSLALNRESTFNKPLDLP